MKKIKDRLIVKLIKSVKDFDYYKKIYNENISKSFKYFAFIIFIYSIFVMTGISYNICHNIENVRAFIQSEISHVNYTDGVLSIDNNEYKSFYNNHVIIDTSDVDIEKYNADVIFGKTDFIVKVEGNNFRFRYTDLINDNFDKQGIIDILDCKKYIVLIVITSLIVSYVTLGISTLIDIFIIALIGFIISGFIGNNKLNLKNTFNIAVHSVTLPIVLAGIYFLVNTINGFYIKYFSTMYTSIATIYMVTAIILINTDKNNNT